MTISAHLTTFAGLPVEDYDPESQKKGKAKYAYRLRGMREYGEAKQPFPELLDRFLDDHEGEELTALVIGAWDYEDLVQSGNGAAEVVEALVAVRKRLSHLRALFFGDITYEECEISWISHGDVSALLPAFPKLEEFRIRGASNLTFGSLKHSGLRSFAIESGGLPEPLLQEVWAAQMPKLEHLELWLGTDQYGGIANPAPLEPLLAGKLFKKLRYLGLRNCEIADEVALEVAKSPLLERLEVLDLSLGNLSERGAEALLTSAGVRKLKKLDLHHHYISPTFVNELKKVPMEVDVSDAREPHIGTYGDTTYVDRYILVSE